MGNTSRIALRKLTVVSAILSIAGLLLIPARAAALEDLTNPAPSGKDAQATTTDDAPAKKSAEKEKEDEKIRVTEGVTVTAKAPPRKTEISPDVRTLPAAATVLERATIETRPYRETAEILRAAPGMDFVYYGQGGAPSGSAFRGYTDRNFGQDLAGFVDGVPLNVFGAVASHGMMDVTSLLPESIDHIDLIRGPFDIRYGDFHRGGSVNFVTREGALHPSVSVSGGSYGELRGLASYGNYDPDQRKISVYANIDVKNSDGYADNQTVEYVRTYDKILIPLGENSDLSVAGLYFDSKWDAPSYLDRDLVRTGALDDQAAVNPTDGGDMQHGLLYTRLRVGATNPLTATLYGASRDWTRFRSDFLISPTTTQVRQIDDRWIWGYRVEKSFGFSLAGNPGVFLVGTSLQRDDAKTIQDRTLLRSVIGNTDNVDELLTQAGGYAQAQWMARSWLKLAGGVRYDHVDYKLHDNIRAPGTYVSDYDAGRWSPKVGIAVSPLSGIEIYANYATGMRSPTPRSEVRNSLSSVGRVEIAKTESYEAGVTARVLERLHVLTGVWQTDNSNEIRGIPPGGVEFESLGKSRRKGVDLEMNWYPWSATRVFGSLSFVDVKLTTPTTPGATHLPDIPEYVHQVGAETHIEPWAGFGGFTVAADWSFYGPKDLNTTGTIRAEKYQRATARVIWAGPKAYRVWVGGVYYPASTIAESAFLFGSKVGVRASPRFSVQGGVGYTFE
jgi:outer membrane receptor protein involved in Fe transport